MRGRVRGVAELGELLTITTASRHVLLVRLVVVDEFCLLYLLLEVRIVVVLVCTPMLVLPSQPKNSYIQ